jgi:hypothetical protein
MDEIVKNTDVPVKTLETRLPILAVHLQESA